ncbi:MAG TPA: DUF1579 domain-containing protein [Candidatus Eisenbacteria bacterium]|jgi:hypothetical protein
MRRARFATIALLILTAGTPLAASGQVRADSTLLAAQREAMARFAFLDGGWRGMASTILPSGEKHVVTQTERIGPFLGGTVKVIEGRGYDENGAVAFNAFGIISYKPKERLYTMRSYAQGLVGDFILTPRPDGYMWEIPAGPATLRYTAVIKGGAWLEIGERLEPGRDPVRVFEMHLTRLGDTTWPEAGAVKPE